MGKKANPDLGMLLVYEELEIILQSILQRQIKWGSFWLWKEGAINGALLEDADNINVFFFFFSTNSKNNAEQRKFQDMILKPSISDSRSFL